MNTWRNCNLFLQQHWRCSFCVKEQFLTPEVILYEEGVIREGGWLPLLWHCLTCFLLPWALFWVFFFGGVLLGVLFFNFLAIFSFILPPRGIACLVSRCPGAARLLWQTAPPHTTPLTPVVTINANSGLPPNTSKQIRPSSCDFLTDEHWPNMTLSRSDTGWFQWGTALGRIAIITKHSTTPKLSWCQTFAFDLRLLSTSLFKYLISNIITSQKAWD